MRDRLKQVMASTFGMRAEAIPDGATIGEFAEWDSLRHLELMLALEMEFAVSISTAAMFELMSLEAIEGFLQEQEALRSG